MGTHAAQSDNSRGHIGSLVTRNTPAEGVTSGRRCNARACKKVLGQAFPQAGRRRRPATLVSSPLCCLPPGGRCSGAVASTLFTLWNDDAWVA